MVRVRVRVKVTDRIRRYGFVLDLGIKLNHSFHSCLLQLTDEHEQRKLKINRLR